jgi:hypothetical protein
MTAEELVALVELINRCPMSMAEKVFVQAIVNKIEQYIIEQPKTEVK